MFVKFIKSRKYKGNITYSKTKAKNGEYFICKNRIFNKQEIGISEDDFNWCTNYKKASSLWKHYYKPGLNHMRLSHDKHPRKSDDNIFRWHRPTEKPIEKMFGTSLEVIGINESRVRKLYVYSRGEWLDTHNMNLTEPPILWHYLPARPDQPEAY